MIAVLLVEDDPAVADAVSRGLTDDGYEVIALAAAGHRGLLGIGSDVVVVGSEHPGAVVGVVDPEDSGRLLASALLDGRRAIATSGSAERGDHIWTRNGATDLRQVTVLAVTRDGLLATPGLRRRFTARDGS